MEYEKPNLEWDLWDMSDIITSSLGDGNGLSVDEGEGGKYEGLPGL